MNRFGVGGDQFLCAYNRMDDHPTISLWVYVFHRRLVAMATTDETLSTWLIAEFKAEGEAGSPAPGGGPLSKAEHDGLPIHFD